LNAARQIYDRLWCEAIPRFEQGRPQTDSYLNDRANDDRRGVTLAFRPRPAVQTAADHFLRQLAAVAPSQYFYRPNELHVTVLAIIPGSSAWREKVRDLAAIHAVISQVLKRHRPFEVAFHGVTASPGAVMIQGFPKDKTLMKIRNDLRKILRDNRLGGDLDRRYKISTAHITAMRFAHARADWRAFVDLLKKNRQTHFGETLVTKLQLLWGDWYASAQSVRTIQEYPLEDGSRAPA